MTASSRIGSCAVLALLTMGAGAASSASAASPPACALVPASAIASDLGMSQIAEVAATTPDTGSGGRLTECRITAWSGSKSKARVTSGTLTLLTIETGEEDAGSPFASKWAAGEALETRRYRESRFREQVTEAEGYVTERAVGTELWDRSHADSPGFNLDGYDEVGGHGRRDILVTWRASQPAGRSVSLNLVLDERKHAFAELNNIARSLVPAFAVSPGEFGSPGAPSPEQRRPEPRYRQCPGARLKQRDGFYYEHFEVKDTTCAQAVAIMRRSLAGASLEGWTLSEGPSYVTTGHKGRARFICYSVLQ